MSEYKDYMVSAIAADGQIRAFAVTSKNLVQKAHEAHNTANVVTAALGRLMSGAVMMGHMLKSDDELLTVKVDGDGPIKGLLVTTNRTGDVKGFSKTNRIELPHNEADHLDVKAAVGKGSLTVIKDMGLKDPYVGTVPIYTGEIAEDLTYYFAASEQTPSSVGLGVLVNGMEDVLEAGGFIIQLLPFAEEDVINTLENKLKKISSVTELLKKGMTPEEMLEYLLEDFDIKLLEKKPVQFKCNCSRERTERALMLLGKGELSAMIRENKTQQVNCHFCGKSYEFTVAEMKELLKRAFIDNMRKQLDSAKK